MDDRCFYGLREVDHRGETAPAPAGFSRRDFLVTSLASGFALAAQPVQASAITTSSEGLTAGFVEVPVADGRLPAYRAHPAQGGRFPTILVIQEIFGVHAYIQDICRRLARLGYYAIAPELFARQGDVSKMSDINQILSEVVSRVPDAQVYADLDAAAAFAEASGKADGARLGVIGFCYGGRMTWLYAHHNPKIKAGVGYYGLLAGLKSPVKPQDPVDIAAQITVPVLGLMAGQDSYVPNAVVDQMRRNLRQGSSRSEIAVIPAVDHGFHADYRPTYDRVAAEYAWNLTQDWFKDHGL
ncbi:MAG TPA: dienelactone hydrolase family protein [Nevskiaceae bacterium]|nr:dienelactone hydrolase family protein [Nevskiaceae bacterium]